MTASTTTRAHALVSDTLLTLAQAYATADGDNGIDRMKRADVLEHMRRVFDYARALDRNWSDREGAALHVLGMLGPNGMGPAIAMLVPRKEAA